MFEKPGRSLPSFGIAVVALLSGGSIALPAVAAPATVPAATDQPIWRATHGLLLGVARAGKRLVAVGDRGIVLLSDDDGLSWTMVASGTQELLTAVVFPKPEEGWAVGQDSTILHTVDAGLHWSVQNTTVGNDQALFAVASLGPDHLMATGAYALILETQDSGHAWTPVKLPNLDEDYHLNCVMAHGADVVLTGEAGHAFVRRGTTWTPMPVPYEGSQFGCLTGRDGSIYSFGLRGSFFVSTAAAPAWHRIDTAEQRPIFGGSVLSNGFFAMVGGNGLVLLFDPQTGKPRTLPAPTGATLSGVVEAANGKWVLVGDDGIHIVDPAAASAQAAEVTQ